MQKPDMSRRYDYRTWEELKTYFTDSDIVIIPTGSCEQHGYHLPLATDTLVADAMANLLGEDENVLVLPALPYGHSSNHECFPGTISISPDTFERFVSDIVRSLLRHGARRFLFINGHSGNTPSLQNVCYFLRRQNAFACIVDWYSVLGQLDARFRLSGHADFVESAAVLAIRPDLVKLERARPYQKRKATREIEIVSWDRLVLDGVTFLTWLETADASASGNFGTLEGSTVEAGEQIFDVMRSFFTRLVREMKKIDPALF